MTTVQEFLANDPLGKADSQLKQLEGMEQFGKYLPPNVKGVWPKVLSRFAHATPLCYWNPQILEAALSVLEANKERTVLALSEWKNRIGIGFDYLLRLAPTEVYEEGFANLTAKDLLHLANEFHPEYLRRCEHIFSNLIAPYWAILRKGGVNATFSVATAISCLKSRGYEILLSGYDDRVRNAIAHGEVVFGGFGIRYGVEAANYELPAHEFLECFDLIWRTVDSLAIALLLFLARYQTHEGAGQFAKLVLPTSIIGLIAAAEVEREGLSVLGSVESKMVSGDRQLHIAIRTVYRNRIAFLLDCSRISLRLLENGALGYTRHLFEIELGRRHTELAIILSGRLAKLVGEGADYSRISEIFDQSQALWYDEGQASRFVRTLRLSWVANSRLAWRKFLSDLQKKGLFPAIGRFRIREIENASAGGQARVNAWVVLRVPSDAQDRNLVREIVLAVTNQLSRSWIETNPSDVTKRINWLGHPQYIWVYLFRLDGPVRWLKAGGWPEGNLIAFAEKVVGFQNQPIKVKQPEEIWKGVRFRYSMDSKEAAKAFAEAMKLVNEIRSQSTGATTPTDVASK